MALQPLPRPAGSSNIMRFSGILREQAAPGAQTINGEVPQGAIADTRILVKFALTDMNNVGAPQTSLPSSVYDDSQPAGDSPHTNAGLNGPSIPAAILLTSPPRGKTWAQNTRVRVQEATFSTVAPFIARVDELLPVISIDAAGVAQGLGQDTGVPVVGIYFYFTVAGIAQLPIQGIPVVVEIEVPHTIQR